MKMAGLDCLTQRRARGKQRLLANDLRQRLRTQASGERLVFALTSIVE
jgi:hypothetical protein